MGAIWSKVPEVNKRPTISNQFAVLGEQEEDNVNEDNPINSRQDQENFQEVNDKITEESLPHKEMDMEDKGEDMDLG